MRCCSWGEGARLQTCNIKSFFPTPFFLLARAFVAALAMQNCQQCQHGFGIWLREITRGLPGPQLRFAIAPGERSSMQKTLSKRQIH